MPEDIPSDVHSAARLKSAKEQTVEMPVYSAFHYNNSTVEELKLPDEVACRRLPEEGKTVWINVDGLVPIEVEKLSTHFGVHSLTIEDILSRNERPKMEESEDVIFCVLPMMFINELSGSVELEQVSLVLGKNFVLSFQEEATRDVFDPIRKQLRDSNSKIRNRSPDYLMYSLLDVIVDSYFDVLEQLADRIENLEAKLIRKQTSRELRRISSIRHDVSVLRRALFPVRELVARFVRSDSNLLDERNEKYYRDVLDHTIQANDFLENHRDMLMNLQDLYMNQINLRMNEVMKVFTLLATLMAPATVIGGVFGMNFDVIPMSHQQTGFWIAVGAMVVIPLVMLVWFHRKGWF
jgi:magnesium transporter